MQGEGGWLARLLVDPEAAIHLPELGFTMILAQLYRGILR